MFLRTFNFFFTYFLIKIFLGLSELMFFFFFRNKKKPKFKNYKILFNRTDRIGDAIVSLPFFLALKKKKYNFKVLSSSYNEWVLKPFVPTITVKDSKFVFFSLKELVRLNFKLPFLIIKKIIKKYGSSYSYIFIDLKGDIFLSQNYSHFCQIHLKHYFLNLAFSDYVINDFYVYGSKKHLIEKYAEFFEMLDDIEEFPEEIKEYIIYHHDKEIDKLINNLKDFIIVYVGNKEFRNLSAGQWKKLIENIEFHGQILIVDEPSKKMLLKIKKIIKRKNTMFLEKTYDLWSLMYLAMFSKLVIGVDGGGFNFLQMPTNAFQILLYTNEKCWRPFSKNPYRLIVSKERQVIEKTITSQGLVKYCFYYDWDFKVVYEILEKKGNFVDRLDIDMAVKEINKFLKCR